MRRVSFFFVMDGPRFQVPAVLLASSLRMQMGDDVEIIAYVPESRGLAMPRVIEILLHQLRVDVRLMKTDHVTWAQAYPHGNKIIASCQPRDSDLSVFLDTDTVCCAPMDFSEVPDDVSFFGVPEGVPTWKVEDEGWQPVYDMFGLPLPQQRVRMVRGRLIEMLPYFNAGFVGFREQPDVAGTRLPDLWLDTALRLDFSDAIEGKRPWLDQIALPVAAARAGGRLHVLPQSYNYSLYRRRPEERSFAPQLAHYHMPVHYRSWDSCRAVTEHTLEICPPNKRDHLRRHLGVFLRGL